MFEHIDPNIFAAGVLIIGFLVTCKISWCIHDRLENLETGNNVHEYIIVEE